MLESNAPNQKGLIPVMIVLKKTTREEIKHLSDISKIPYIGMPTNATIRCLVYKEEVENCKSYSIYYGSLMLGKLKEKGKNIAKIKTLQTGRMILSAKDVEKIHPVTASMIVGEKYGLLGNHFLGKRGAPVILAYDCTSKQENIYYAAKMEIVMSDGSDSLINSGHYFRENPKKYNEIIDSFDHPHICKHFPTRYKTDIGGTPVVITIMELLDHTIQDEIAMNPPTPDKFVEYITQIISALDHMFQKGVRHADVKPDNISTKNGIIKLIDWDSLVPCNLIGHPDPKLAATQRGTPGFVRNMPVLVASHSMDMYATGKTFLHLLDNVKEKDSIKWLRDVLIKWFCHPNPKYGISCPVLCKALLERKYTGNMVVVVFYVSDSGYNSLNDPLNEIPGPARKIKNPKQNWSPCGKFRVNRNEDGFEYFLQADVISISSNKRYYHSMTTIKSIVEVSEEEYERGENLTQNWWFVSENEFIYKDNQSNIYWKHTLSSKREPGPDTRRISYLKTDTKLIDRSATDVSFIIKRTKWSSPGKHHPTGGSIEDILTVLKPLEGNVSSTVPAPGNCTFSIGDIHTTVLSIAMVGTNADWTQVEFLTEDEGTLSYIYKRCSDKAVLNNTNSVAMMNWLIRIAMEVCLEHCGIDLGIVPCEVLMSPESKVLFIESNLKAIEPNMPIDNGLHRTNISNASIGISVVENFFDYCKEKLDLNLSPTFIQLPDGRIQYTPITTNIVNKDLLESSAIDCGLTHRQKDEYVKTCREKLCDKFILNELRNNL